MRVKTRVNRRSVGDSAWLEALLADPFGSLEGEGAVLMRRRRDTSVHRVTAGGREVVIKHFAAPPLSRLPETMLRGPKALEEYRRALELERRGIPVATPWFFAVRRRLGLPRESLYAMEYLPEARTVWALVSEESALGVFRGRRRVRFLRALAGFLVALARSGVRHPDQHLANVLVVEKDGEPRFFLIDYRHLAFSDPPAEGDLESLVAPAMTSLWVTDTRSRSDRRLAAAVASAAGGTRRERRERYAALWEGLRRWWARYIVSQDRKCLRDGSRFRLRREGGASIIERRRDDVAGLVRDFRRTVLQGGETPGPGPGPFRTFRGDTWVLSYTPEQGSLAEKTWIGMERLSVRKFPVAPLLAFIREADGSSAILLERVPGDFDCTTWEDATQLERPRRYEGRRRDVGLVFAPGARVLIDRERRGRFVLADTCVDEPRPFPGECARVPAPR